MLDDLAMHVVPDGGGTPLPLHANHSAFRGNWDDLANYAPETHRRRVWTGIPTGRYTLTVVLPGIRFEPAPVEISAGETTPVTLNWSLTER